MTEAQMKDFVVNVSKAFAALDNVTEGDIERLMSMANQPVGLGDTPKFNISIDVITKPEISAHRRALAAAIAAEKWEQGFVTGVQLMMMLGSFGI